MLAVKNSQKRRLECIGAKEECRHLAGRGTYGREFPAQDRRRRVELICKCLGHDCCGLMLSVPPEEPGCTWRAVDHRSELAPEDRPDEF